MRVAIALMVGLCTCTALAQDGDDDAADEVISREPERCLRVRSIRRTEVLDNQTIVFFMRNRDIYVNTLPRECPQLGREQRFAYEARGGNLCDTDMITVLLQFGGRFDPGFTCRLGQFVPADQETVDILIEASKTGGAEPPVSAEPVDLPPEEGSEPESETTQTEDGE